MARPRICHNPYKNSSPNGKDEFTEAAPAMVLTQMTAQQSYANNLARVQEFPPKKPCRL